MDKFEASLLTAKKLNAGYGEKIVVRDVDFLAAPGKILTLIGPNGCGKSTIIKTITRQLSDKGGSVFIGKEDYKTIPLKDFAKKVSVMLTKRPNPEYMTCFEVVAMGRFPYTDTFGSLSREDKEAVIKAMELSEITGLSDTYFDNISDGQKQRVMLARAIAQSPRFLVMDEPTTYLDIKYKIGFLKIVKTLSDSGVCIIVSIHELELAKKISDEILCIKNGEIVAKGSPKEIFTAKTIGSLYNLDIGELRENFSHLISFENSEDVCHG